MRTRSDGFCPPPPRGGTLFPASQLHHQRLASFRPRCWSSEGMRPSESECGFFQRNCSGLRLFLWPAGWIPAGFGHREFQSFRRLLFLAPGTLGCGTRWGSGTPCSEISLLNGPPLPPHLSVGLASAPSPLPVLAHAVSWSPSSSDFWPLRFPTVPEDGPSTVWLQLGWGYAGRRAAFTLASLGPEVHWHSSEPGIHRCVWATSTHGLHLS